MILIGFCPRLPSAGYLEVCCLSEEGRLRANLHQETMRRAPHQQIQPDHPLLLRGARVHAVQVRLADWFGDFGFICVIIARHGASVWTIDTWLISCRVLERRIEQTVLAQLVAAALLGSYVSSRKHMKGTDHFARYGFVADGSDCVVSHWRLDLPSLQASALPMTLIDTLLPAPHTA